MNTNIQFCLARNTAPLVTSAPAWGGWSVSGEYGVMRYENPAIGDHHITAASTSQLFNATQTSNYYYPPERMINIWVVQTITGSVGGSIMAYYTSSVLNGIVIRADVFGSNVNPVGGTYNLIPNSAYSSFLNATGLLLNQGKVLVHEVGHYLSLYHPFQNNLSNPSLTCAGCGANNDGDFCFDTEPCIEPTVYYNCLLPIPNTCSCSSDPDPIHNYMYYSTHDCQLEFTQRQSDRMAADLILFRNTLYTVSNQQFCGIIGLTSCIPAQPFADFSNSGGNCVNQTITFSSVVPPLANTALPSGLTWSFQGGTPSTSNSPTPNVVWNIPGTYNVTCVATDGVSTVTSSQQIAIIPCSLEPGTLNKTNWYFGQFACIDFSSGVPLPSSNGRIPPTVLTNEGAYSYSDNTGALVFYTDGTNIWDANHTQLNTVPVFPTLGPAYPNPVVGPSHLNSSYGIIGIPIPGSDPAVTTNKYYIFSSPSSWNDYYNPALNQVLYVILDLNAGASQVVSPTMTLTTSLGSSTRMSEGLTVIPHCNGKDYWLVFSKWALNPTDSKAMISYLISQYGISQLPNIFTTGFLFGNNQVNTIKSSPDCSKIVCSSQSNYPEIGVYDFNNSNGVISNEIVKQAPNGYSQITGVSFSSNSQYIYGNARTPGNIIKFDLSSNNGVAITSDGIANTYYSQLGPDGNIYVGNRYDIPCATCPQYVSRIANPNTTPVWQQNILDLNDPILGTSNINDQLSMVNLMDGMKPNYSPPSFSIAYNSCAQVSLSVSACWDGYDYYIDWGDGTPPIIQTALPQNLSHTYITGGIYNVTVIWLPPGTSVIPTNPLQVIQVVNINLSSSLLINGSTNVTACSFISPSYSVLAIAGATYVWSIPSGAGLITQNGNTATVSWNSAGIFPLNCTVTNGLCSLTGSLMITVGFNVATISATPSSICLGQGSSLEVLTNCGTTATGLTYSWNPTTGLSSSSIYNPIVGTISTTTTYTVTVTDANGITATSSVTIQVSPIPNVSLTTSSSCLPSLLTASGGYSSYTWTDPSGIPIISTNTFNATLNGLYTVQVTSSGCSSSSSITLSTPPLIAIATSSLCPPATLTATSGYASYNWSGPSGSITTTLNTYSATLPGVYNVQIANNGCSASSSLSVGFQASITSGTGTNCTPNELFAHPTSVPGGATYTYSWTLPPGGAGPTNLPNTASQTAQGAYTVTVTDANGCTSSATFFLSNGPTGLAISSTLSGAPCVNTQAVNLTATVGPTSIQPFDYAWTGPSSTNFSNTTGSPLYTNSAVWNPLIGSGTFTVTVTDTWHCSNTTSLFVNPQNTNNLFCCSQAATSIAANSSTFLLDDRTSSSTGYTIITGTTVFIDGIFTVNQASFTFKNCTIYLTPNSKIEVLANCSLTIKDGSVLEAAPGCNMWDGIYASDPASQVFINSSSILRDMENGVVISNQGKLVTADAWYKDNYTSIHLKDLPSTYSGSIERCTFMKSTGLIAPWGLLVKPKHGIVIENCKYATVGNLTNTTGGNTFNDLWNGIYMHTTSPFTATPSTIFIYFNKFTNIIGGVGFGAPPPAPTDNNMYTNPDGCAIFGDNKDKKYNISTRILGNNGNSTIVNFDNCNKAIILNSFNGRINNNRSSLTDVGILLNQTEGKSMEVLSNTLDGVRLGISNVGNAQNFHTDNNTVTLSQMLQSLGITSTYPTPVNTGITQIHGNIIEIPGLDYATGIGLYSGSNDDIQFNEIHFSNTSNIASISSAPTLLGMKLTLNMGTWINGNTITGENNSDFYNKRRVAALYMHKNQKNLVDCNIANYLQFGIYAVGDNNTGNYDRVRNNVFTTQTAGLLLRHLSNEGTLGHIGYENSAPPYDKYDGNNRFHGNNTLNKVYRFTTCSTLTFDKILTQSTNLVQANSTNSTGNPGCNYKVFNPIFNSNEIYWCTPPNYITGCGNGGAIPNPDLHDIQTAIEIAEDTRQYSEFIDGGKWLDRRMLYDWLNRDSTIRVNNPILDSFYLSFHTREIEHLWIVDELVGQLTDSTIMESEQEWNDILSQARNENDGVASTELFAANEKWINNIYLNYLEAGLDTISQEEFEAIQTLAESCPYTEGSAVFKARGIYAMYVPGVDYDDMEICNNVGVYKGGKSLYDQENELLSGKINKFTAEDLMVYPNPASDILTLEYSLSEEIKGELTILDMLGNTVQNIKISSNLNKVTFNLNKLSAGIYVYKFVNDEQATYSGKLIIE